jgi:hypothetical protein
MYVLINQSTTPTTIKTMTTSIKGMLYLLLFQPLHKAADPSSLLCIVRLPAFLRAAFLLAIPITPKFVCANGRGAAAA